MSWRNNQLNNTMISIGLAFLLLIIVVIVSLSSSTENEKSVSVVNAVSDSSSGLSFSVPKTFLPIPRADLSKLNPDFSYGYQPTNDPKAQCIVSTDNLSKGSITATELKEGLFSQVKAVHPDVKLDNSETADKPVKFGNGIGVLLQLSYKDGKDQVKRIEAKIVGQRAQVTAYCQSLARDNQRY